MKQFILGFMCGIVLTATTAAFASNTIQAYLFPVAFEVNGQMKILDSQYDILNDKGQAYHHRLVPGSNRE